MARLIFLYLAFLIMITSVSIISICNGNSIHAVCIESEKEALLKFKQGIVDRHQTIGLLAFRWRLLQMDWNCLRQHD
ncbi:hypothetical protein SLA2020_310410 [Shorea laevis]